MSIAVTEQLDAVAAKVRDGIRSDVETGARALIEFAGQYSVDPALQDEALVLNLDAGAPEAKTLESEIETRMLRLVDRIVETFAVEGGEEAIRKRHDVLLQAGERLRATAPEEPPAFVGKGLVKAYPGTDFQLGEVNLTMRVGEITGIVGQNAHGKTTLLRIIAGELRPDRGVVSYPLFGGGDSAAGTVDWVQVKSSLAYVPQELQPWRGGLRETLHYEAALHRIHGAENERQVRFVIERLRLGEHLDKNWAALSGGTKLRFALARALVWKPRLLVLDEPLANLDIKAKSVLLQDVRDLARSYRYPIAVAISSHELHSLEAVCRQMVFLRNGKVEYAGLTSAVGERSESNEFEIETPLALHDVRDRLAHPDMEDIREDGVSLRLRTGRSLSASALLRLLLDRSVEIRSFRDVSRSTRRLFE